MFNTEEINAGIAYRGDGRCDKPKGMMSHSIATPEVSSHRTLLRLLGLEGQKRKECYESPEAGDKKGPNS